MLSSVASGAADGAGVDYGREWSLYVTLRSRWLFSGDVKGDYSIFTHPENNKSLKENIKNAWSGSGEFGVSCFDERISVGLELGYFTGKAAFEFDDELIFPAEFGNTFGACNVTLRRDVGERAFLYGGVGAGIARSTLKHPGYLKGHDMGGGHGAPELYFNKKSEWRFLGQAFAGIGVYLNDSWSLSAGYRLRYVPGKFNSSWTKDPAYAQSAEIKSTIKQNIVHAAEIGLTYQF